MLRRRKSCVNERKKISSLFPFRFSQEKQQSEGKFSKRKKQEKQIVEIYSIMVSAELLTGLGAAASIFFCSTGAAVASAPAGVFALRSSTYKAFIPIVIAGVLAIYGIIVAVILAGNLKQNGSSMTESDGYKQLAAGLSVGLGCLASGLGMVSLEWKKHVV
jgi:ATP synthase proteolipid subunit